MAGDYALLMKATARPMARWWARYGVWWLVGIALAYIKDAAGGAYLLQTGQQVSLWSVLAWFPVPGSLIVMCWFHAGLTAIRLSELPSSEISKERNMLQARFRLALFQGIPPLVAALIFGMACGMLQHAYIVRILHDAGSLAELPPGIFAWPRWIKTELHQFGFSAWASVIEALWLFALALVLPAQRFKCWMLLFVPMALGLVAMVVNLSFMFKNADAYYQLSVWPIVWVLGAAVVFGMLLAHRAKAHQAGNYLFYILLISLCADYPLWQMYSADQSILIAIPAQISHGIAFFYSGYLNQEMWLSGLMQHAFPADRSVLGLLEYVRPAFFRLGWLALMFAIIYYVILRPEQPEPTDTAHETKV